MREVVVALAGDLLWALRGAATNFVFRRA